MLKILLAGQGGQGVLSAGRFLVESGLREGKEVTYLPAYGAEMRGGTANCSVTISDEPIASPLCNKPDVLIAMNMPSFHRFAGNVQPGGYIFVNSSLSDSDCGRDDVTVYSIPANDLAIEAGSVKSANMVIVGALFGALHVVKEESILECLKEKFPGKPKVVEMNARAFEAGKKTVQ